MGWSWSRNCSWILLGCMLDVQMDEFLHMGCLTLHSFPSTWWAFYLSKPSAVMVCGKGKRSKVTLRWTLYKSNCISIYSLIRLLFFIWLLNIVWESEHQQAKSRVPCVFRIGFICVMVVLLQLWWVDPQELNSCKGQSVGNGRTDIIEISQYGWLGSFSWIVEASKRSESWDDQWEFISRKWRAGQTFLHKKEPEYLSPPSQWAEIQDRKEMAERRSEVFENWSGFGLIVMSLKMESLKKK